LAIETVLRLAKTISNLDPAYGKDAEIEALKEVPAFRQARRKGALDL
jgi:hypothetical protein